MFTPRIYNETTYNWLLVLLHLKRPINWQSVLSPHYVSQTHIYQQSCQVEVIVEPNLLYPFYSRFIINRDTASCQSFNTYRVNMLIGRALVQNCI